MFSNCFAKTKKMTIHATITRANGQVEDLGIISEQEINFLEYCWNRFVNSIKKIFKNYLV